LWAYEETVHGVQVPMYLVNFAGGFMQVYWYVGRGISMSIRLIMTYI